MEHRILAASAWAAILGAVMSIASAAEPGQVDRDYLWKLTSLKCLRHLSKAEAPIPCDSVDVSKGWESGVALLKDHVGRGRMLAIATHVVTGIEDPAVLSAGEPDYFAVAWTARKNVMFHLGRNLAPLAVAITVDSKPARDQDQLHLIVDCVDKDVAAALAAHADALDDQWRRMPVALKGRVYWARQLKSFDGAENSPFRLLFDGVEGAKADMGSWSLAAVPALFANESGFILLADHSDAAGGGRASDLQDPSCAIAAQ
jgi:CDP-diacylglycerol pyrophosphatase